MNAFYVENTFAFALPRHRVRFFNKTTIADKENEKIKFEYHAKCARYNKLIFSFLKN